MVSLMSNIDANLANKAITLEHLNHLPLQEPLVDLTSLPDRTMPFPYHPDDPRLQFKGIITHTILDVCKKGFYDESGRFPIVARNLKAFTKYHVRWKCTVGSQHSGNEYALNRRDDSYIWWDFREEANGPNNTKILGEIVGRRYGQVVLFAEAYSWPAIAVVRPFKTTSVVYDRELELVSTGGQIAPMEFVRVQNIGGLLGRINNIMAQRQTTYLVGRWEELGIEFPDDIVVV